MKSDFFPIIVTNIYLTVPNYPPMSLILGLYLLLLPDPTQGVLQRRKINPDANEPKGKLCQHKYPTNNKPKFYDWKRHIKEVDSFHGHDPKWTGYVGCKVLLTGTVSEEGYAVAWSVRGEYLEFFLQGWRNLGGPLAWLALGINDNPGMRGMDVLVLRKDEKGLPYVEDRYSDKYSGTPKLDRQQDVELLGYWEEGIFTHALVRRPIMSCDRYGEDNSVPSIKDTLSGEETGYPYFLAWAFGYDHEFTKHQWRGSFVVNFYFPNQYTMGQHPMNSDTLQLYVIDLPKKNRS